MRDTPRGASLVAAGILLSRIAGFLRESVFAYYLGNSGAADIFRAALRIPNFLQNLLGEGVLSASFIPTYSKTLESDPERARSLALAVGTLLSGVVVTLSLLGILFAPQLVDVIVPGFEGETREQAIELVRILFPGASLLAISAWCLGILNSHRKFFLSYAAPVIWNLTIVVFLAVFGRTSTQNELIWYASIGVVAGSLLQFAAQFIAASRYLTPVRFIWDLSFSELRLVLRNFFPAVFGRGVVQISAFVDSMIASLLPAGALAALGYAQMLYLLPVSLFGMSITAAELPELSRTRNDELIRQRVERGLSRLTFFVVPCMAAYIFIGRDIIAALYQRGAFDANATRYVWALLAVLSLGLLASVWSRLLASIFYAAEDTKTPLRYALIRVIVSAATGAVLALYGPELLSIERRWGILGLALGTGVGAWIETALLRRAILSRFGFSLVFPARLGQILFSATVAGLTALCAITMMELHALLGAAMACTIFGLTYALFCLLLGVDEVRRFLPRKS